MAAVMALVWVTMKLFRLLLREKDRAFDEMKEERDNWRTIALAGQHVAERTVTMAEHQVGLAER